MKIYPVQVNYPRDSNSIPDSAVYEGVRVAIAPGVKVINCSFGSSGSVRPLLESMIRDNPNVVFICATGNTGSSSVFYPAAFANNPAGNTYPNTISVGYMDQFNHRSKWHVDSSLWESNYGQGIKITAPGSSIPGTYLDGTYPSGGNGTSFATPEVSGVFGGLWGACSALPYWQVRDVIYAHTTVLDGTLYPRDSAGWN